MAARLFDSRSITLSIAAASGFVKVFESNSTRVSLLVSSDGTLAANTELRLSTKQSNAHSWFRLNFPFARSFPYRDFGPLIKEPLFVQVGNGVANVTATEIFAVSQAL